MKLDGVNFCMSRREWRVLLSFVSKADPATLSPDEKIVRNLVTNEFLATLPRATLVRIEESSSERVDA